MSWSILVAFYKYRPSNLGNNIGGLMKFFIGSEQKKSWFERIVSKTIPGKPSESIIINNYPPSFINVDFD